MTEISCSVARRNMGFYAQSGTEDDEKNSDSAYCGRSELSAQKLIQVRD